MDDKIHFPQKPYQVVYKDFHTGELKTVTRRPPMKNHDILPTDLVELKTGINADFNEGAELQVKHISYRAPNTLQLVRDDKETVFVSASDVILKEERAFRGTDPIDDERLNRYLLWP